MRQTAERSGIIERIPQTHTANERCTRGDTHSQSATAVIVSALCSSPPLGYCLLCLSAVLAVVFCSAGVIGGIQEAIVKSRFFPDAPSTEQASMSGVLTACLLLGAFIGCFLGVAAGNRWGHRFSLRITGINCLVCSVVLAFVPNFALIVIVRTMLGLSVGFATALCPWYVTDAIPAATRGSIGTIFQINICAFILVGEIVNYLFHPDASDTNIYIPDWKWKLQLTLSAAPGLFLWVLSYVMHENPVYIAKIEEAEAKASGVVGMAGAGSEHSQMISVTIDSASAVLALGNETPVKAGYRELFSGRNLNWVFIGLILSSSNQLTGINAIIFYAPKIFTDAHLSVNPLVMTIAVVGSWNLISVFISFGLVDRLGRRPLMLGALALMGLGAGMMAAAYQFFPQSSWHAPVAIVALLLFVGAFECGPGPLFFLMAVRAQAHAQEPASSIRTQQCARPHLQRGVR